MWFVDSSARDRAAPETELPENTCPAACSVILDQITGDWLPEK